MIREHAITGMNMRALRPRLVVSVILVFAFGIYGCQRQDSAPAGPVGTSPASRRAGTQAPSTPEQHGPMRDLSMDESMGGHTLARHVGKTDAELRDRLRRESQISSASTYTDRATAEQAVGVTLTFASDTLGAWQSRSGRRPNLVLHSIDHAKQPLGRSLSRGQRTPVPCNRVLVVLKWDERANRFYVLTSYPEAER